jgi:hypothetical protein
MSRPILIESNKSNDDLDYGWIFRHLLMIVVERKASKKNVAM